MSARALIKLALAVAAMGALSLACSAALDFDKLNSETPDGSAVEDGTTEDAKKDLGPPPDMKECKPDAACKVAGKQGACAQGKQKCEASGVGTCEQTVQPTEEKCDGKDTDCDGKADKDDVEAHKACGSKKYCAGSECVDGCQVNTDCANGNICNTETNQCVCGDSAGCTGENQCRDGKCLCAGKLSCGPGESCSGGKCTCGGKSNAGGPACAQPNPRCVNDNCACDGKSTCNANETCKSGVCNCGQTAGQPTGPFCPAGDCIAAEGKCQSTPVDAGPDVGPDMGIDQGTDGPQTDGTAPDGAPDGSEPDGAATDALPSDGPALDSLDTGAAVDTGADAADAAS